MVSQDLEAVIHAEGEHKMCIRDRPGGQETSGTLL